MACGGTLANPAICLTMRPVPARGGRWLVDGDTSYINEWDANPDSLSRA